MRPLAIVLGEMGLGVRLNAPIDVVFHGQNIGRFYADMVVNDTILVEVKATRSAAPHSCSRGGWRR